MVRAEGQSVSLYSFHVCHWFSTKLETHLLTFLFFSSVILICLYLTISQEQLEASLMFVKWFEMSPLFL